jgi:putative zinc finger/helix-turn-helix YgiT family protein
MEEHEVNTVEVTELEAYKGVDLEFTATYDYCSNTDGYLETEDMIRANSLAVKDAYRRKIDLLTSSEIKSIRDKYGISQKDFSEILDWGRATITRYENHQVQDRAHDDILRKINTDPKWLLDMIIRAKGRLSPKAFSKYRREANEQYSQEKNQYLIDAIHAIYADFSEETATGFTKLNLGKVIEVINYLAKKVGALHKVKLIQMLWQADLLNFQRHRKSITGLAYRSLQMGAVPEGFEQIMLLNGVSFDTVLRDENIEYRFRPAPGFAVRDLSEAEIETIDQVISEFGDLSAMQIERLWPCTS